MRDIAGRAGISLGNLYNHFAGKTDIIAAIASLDAEEMAAHTHDLETAAPGSKTAVHDFVRRYFASAIDPGNAALAAEITAEAFRDLAIEREFSAARDKTAKALAGHLTGTGAEQVERANLVLDLIDGAALRACGQPKSQQMRTLNEIQTLISVFLNSS